nr:[formate-C-acetyltransferase]-activating enzyme [Sporosalibacterium faouarense]
MMIFNIQKFSIHDGGGIRTIIFFKGCPMRCPWCANPESQVSKPQLMRKESLCIGCNGNKCSTCNINPEECPTGALEILGSEMTISEIVKEVKKDMVFYDSSQGGVTLSGGEPLMQGKGAIELLKRLKSLGIDTALETCGSGSWEILDKMSDYLDRVLFDLKIMDKQQAKKVLKGDAELIKNNFKGLVEKGIKIIPRIPLIPNYTMPEDNIDAIINFLKPLGIKEVHILPFHQYGSSKYKSLGISYSLTDLNPPNDEEIKDIEKKFINNGFEVIVGGK